MLLIGFPVHEFVTRVGRVSARRLDGPLPGPADAQPASSTSTRSAGCMLISQRVLTQRLRVLRVRQADAGQSDEPVRAAVGARQSSRPPVRSPTWSWPRSSRSPLRIILNRPASGSTWPIARAACAVINIIVLLRADQRVPVHLQPDPRPATRRLACAVGLSSRRAMPWQLRQFEMQYAQMIPFVFLVFVFLLAPEDHRTARRAHHEHAARPG